MRGAGILQRGAPMLERASRWFGLPEQSELAADVVGRLRDAFSRVSQLHDFGGADQASNFGGADQASNFGGADQASNFGRGMGLSAPQIGIDWAATVVRPPDSTGEA